MYMDPKPFKGCLVLKECSTVFVSCCCAEPERLSSDVKLSLPDAVPEGVESPNYLRLKLRLEHDDNVGLGVLALWSLGFLESWLFGVLALLSHVFHAVSCG